MSSNFDRFVQTGELPSAENMRADIARWTSSVRASTKYPARFEPRFDEYGRRVWTVGDQVFTTDGVQIVQGLRVFTNNLDRGTVDLSRAHYDWHGPEDRWQLWFDVILDHDYKGNVIEGRREMQSDCRVTTRFEGRNA